MKCFPLLFLLIMSGLFADRSNAQMRQVYVGADENNEVERIDFYTPSEGYVAFSKWIGFTTDSGRTYTKKYITYSNVDFGNYSVNLTFGFGINGVKSFGKDTLIVYGDYGFVPAILYSVNQGNSFKLVYHSQLNSQQLTRGIMSMAFASNPNVGYAVEADRIIKTTNKGLTWSVVRTELNSFFDFVQAFDNNVVYALSTNYSVKKLLKSTDGGFNWQRITLPLNEKIESGFFLTANKGWLNIIDPNTSLSKLFYTANGGQSWNQKNDISAAPLHFGKLVFVNDSTGYACESLYTIYKTTDSGKVWQPLLRNNAYEYLGYGHKDIFCLSATQLWAGGGHGFLELSTNGGGNPLPKAYFKIDTSGFYINKKVNLVNYSKPGSQYKWYVNNVVVSTDLHANYIHDPNSTVDSIKLIVTSGAASDTLVKYQYFNLDVIVTSFTPTIAATGTAVLINGNNFSNISRVLLGSVAASSFTVISPTQIKAVVGNGASGNVIVITAAGNGGSLPGFVYVPPPSINLPVSIADSILCKSETVAITIKNTEANVQYDLIDSLNFPYGAVTGNGSTVVLNSYPISKTGNYKLRASRVNVSSTQTFTDKIFIIVEKTKSLFIPTKTNVLPGEKLNFYNRSLEASTFDWKFNEDATIKTTAAPNPQNIAYAGPGQKTLTLVSTSIYGCKDTLTGDAVFVYSKPTPGEACYAQNIDDNEFSYYPDSPPGINNVTLVTDNGYIISGAGNKPLLKGHIGNPKAFTLDGTAYLAKYSTDGALNWSIHISNGGKFTETQTDAAGNIYVIGYCQVRRWLTLVNGDSIKIAATSNDTVDYTDKINGFLLKLDGNGNYVWHTIFDDPAPLWQGCPVQGGLPTTMTIGSSKIVIAGDFQRNLAYWKNGVKTTLVSLAAPCKYLLNHFVVGIEEDGDVSWNMYFDNTTTNYKSSVSGVGMDKSGNCYITGNYENSVTIYDAGDKKINFAGKVAESRAYLLKVSPSGNLIWHVSLSNSFSFRDISTSSIATDENGASYLTGGVTLNSKDQYFQITNSDGSIKNVSFSSFFLLKFDSNGFYQWGVGSKYGNGGGGHTLSLKGGDIFATVTMGENALGLPDYMIASADGSEVQRQLFESEFCIVNYDTAGILKRIVNSGRNTGGHVSPAGLIMDSDGNLVVSGITDNFNGGNSTFDLFGKTIRTNGMDAFFVKLNADYCLPSTPPVAYAGADRTQCPGTTTRLGIGSNGDFYSWTSIPVGFTSALAHPIVSPVVTTTYFLTVINSAGMITRDTVIVKVQDLSAANAGSDQSICAGEAVTIGATPIPGLQYSWSSNPTDFSSSLANPTVSPEVSTTYYLSVVDVSGCVGRDTISIIVNTGKTPSVSIAASTVNICKGESITFTATAIDGGQSPVFQWKRGGINMGTNSSTYTANILENGDVISVTLTSDLPCANPTTVRSNQIKIEVNSVTPTIKINGITKVTSGTSSDLSTEITNGGTNPAYQWQDSTAMHGWQNISGAIFNTLSYEPKKTGDKTRCVLSSNIPCAVASAITSEPLVFEVMSGRPSAEPAAVIYYPNPATSHLIIDSLKISDLWETLDITNLSGTNKLITQNISNTTRVTIALDRLANGMYVAVLRRKTGSPVYLKFVKM